MRTAPAHLQPPTAGPSVPAPRGELSEAVVRTLRGAPGATLSYPSPGGTDPLADEDLQLALYTCYELTYRGFDGVDPEWEWDPGLLGCRRAMERSFEGRLRDITAIDRDAPVSAPAAAEELRRLASDEGDRSLSAEVEENATLEQFREMCVHRSAWQLKEADPHSWAIPRLEGAAKVTLVELQHDEYGAGDPADNHATLFAGSLRALGLDPAYGAYVDYLPAVTLATVNLVSMLGLHRRLQSALVGHLALFEMTSAGPMSKFSRALARLGFGVEATRFFDVHVAADVRHGEIASSRLVGRILQDDPAAADGLVFGARALTEVERRFTDLLLDSWDQGRTSLLSPLPESQP